MTLLLLLLSTLDLVHYVLPALLFVVLIVYVWNRKVNKAKELDFSLHNTNRVDTTSTKKKKDDGPVVQVYILLGQSNMLGMGHVEGDKNGTLEYAVKKKGLYPYLVDCNGNWTTSNRIRNVRVMDGKGGTMAVFHNEFLTVRGHTIGPEIGIGHAFEQQQSEDTPIMLLKSCIGNRSLGWDLLPPGSKPFEFNDNVYAGYGQTPSKCPKGSPPPAKPTGKEWYAGKQYDDDIKNAKQVLNDLQVYYPGMKKYNVAGFFWWQGDKDRYDTGHATVYEKNLVRLIKQLRVEFDAPNAKFVLATLGQDVLDKSKGNDKLLLQAMMAVDGNAGNYPEFVGNVATVYSHPLSKGGASNGHYGGNAETYMNIGQAMGQAMVELTPNNNNAATTKTEEMV